MPPSMNDRSVYEMQGGFLYADEAVAQGGVEGRVLYTYESESCGDPGRYNDKCKTNAACEICCVFESAGCECGTQAECDQQNTAQTISTILSVMGVVFFVAVPVMSGMSKKFFGMSPPQVIKHLMKNRKLPPRVVSAVAPTATMPVVTAVPMATATTTPASAAA